LAQAGLVQVGGRLHLWRPALAFKRLRLQASWAKEKGNGKETG